MIKAYMLQNYTLHHISCRFYTIIFMQNGLWLMTIACVQSHIVITAPQKKGDIIKKGSRAIMFPSTSYPQKTSCPIIFFAGWVRYVVPSIYKLFSKAIEYFSWNNMIIEEKHVTLRIEEKTPFNDNKTT